MNSPDHARVADPSAVEPREASRSTGATWPTVSVVIPTRGRPELVRDSVRGAVAQDYAGDLEIVVVHDQEPVDETLAELGTPTRPVRALANTGTPGLAGARNAGLAATSAEIVASLDDDDVWHASKLHQQVARLQADPSLIVVGSGIRLMLPDDIVADWPARDEIVTNERLLRNRVKELHSSTLVMRRTAFERAGLYDETLPHGYAEDYDWVLRAARVGRVGCVTEPLADINKRHQSWYAGRSENTLEALSAFLERHPEIRTSRRGYARLLGQMGFVESVMGRRTDAVRHATRGLLAWPLTPHVWLAFVHIVFRIQPARLLGLARRFGRGLS